MIHLNRVVESLEAAGVALVFQIGNHALQVLSKSHVIHIWLVFLLRSLSIELYHRLFRGAAAFVQLLLDLLFVLFLVLTSHLADLSSNTLSVTHYGVMSFGQSNCIDEALYSLEIVVVRDRRQLVRVYTCAALLLRPYLLERNNSLLQDEDGPIFNVFGD